MTQSSFENTLEYAQQQDNADELKGFREKFHIPTMPNGQQEIYFCGNSLGLQPKNTRDEILFELDKWQRLGVRGHFEDKFPWMPYHENLTPYAAALVGAKDHEVVIMNSLTANLHFMMVSFYRPTSQRHQIMIEDHAFPSDHYAVESQIKHHGRSSDESLVLLKPREGEDLLRTEDILQRIDDNRDTLALILLPGLQYYTGQLLDIETITRHAQQYDIVVGVDLAHAAGNVPLQLHDWNVDFACWCNYKYLNSGPGAVGGCFVHERHSRNTDLVRFAGWWGHDKASRFKMENHFQPIASAEGWQLSNPPILSLTAIRASYEVFAEAGGVARLREKSLRLTGYLEYLLGDQLPHQVSVITPSQTKERGCQLSLSVALEGKSGRAVYDQMIAAGISCDWREPNVIRVAPVPLYNNFEDVHRFTQTLKELLV